MEKRLLLIQKAHGYSAKNVTIVKDPSALRPLLNPVSWKILSLLSRKPMYVVEIANSLRMYRQSVYTLIRQLKKSGLIVVDREEVKRGGTAKYYRVVASSFGVELPNGEEASLISGFQVMSESTSLFFKEFISKGEFVGRIVVGSPYPHGPYSTVARDGHYGIQLGFYLGGFCRIKDEFLVKLDVDVKAEKEEGKNLILIGGPGTNLITADMNKYLPVKFEEANYWAGLRDSKGQVYNSDLDGIVAKIRSPYDPTKAVIILAGVRYLGTKSAIIGITGFANQLFKDYKGEKVWASVIRGYDRDGDGKPDSIEVAARYTA